MPTATGANGLPSKGRVELDFKYSKDFKSHRDYFRAIVIHELGHVLGIGTLWDGLIDKRIVKPNDEVQVAQ